MSTDLTLAPARRRVIFALLAASLVCNAAAMLSPFMDLRVGAFSEPYSLTRSVKMMWSQGLYVLAVLVVGFSVFFPFAKIGVLAWVAGGRALDARRRRWLGVVEMLGKWSMLDVFLVCLILTLTSGQIMVGAKPLIGIPLFVAAIFLSMLSGELLTGALRHEVAASPHRPSAQTGAYLLLQGIALLGTLTLPILRISDWKLADHTYSVLTVVPTLWAKNSPVSAVVVTAFLLLAPLVAAARRPPVHPQPRAGQPTATLEYARRVRPGPGHLFDRRRLPHAHGGALGRCLPGHDAGPPKSLPVGPRPFLAALLIRTQANPQSLALLAPYPSNHPVAPVYSRPHN
jgi:paraquat-inducible protein A